MPKAIGKTVMWGLIVWGVIAFYGAPSPLSRFYGRDASLPEPLSQGLLLRRLLLFPAGREVPVFAGTTAWAIFICVCCPCSGAWSGSVFGRSVADSTNVPIDVSIRWPWFASMYIPIMVSQVYLNVTMLTATLRNENMQWTLPVVLWMVTLLSWLIDSNNAAIGYFWESWFTKTRFRDMDPYPIHWFVVLMCYVPFIGFAGQFVPFPSLSDDSARLFQSGGINAALDVGDGRSPWSCTCSAAAPCGSAPRTCATRRVQTRGPYAIVRHPATTCKLVFFFIAFFRYRQAFSFVGILCFGIWLGVYICRALVEERFLRHYPAYRNYMKKTRYRFIPGLC